MKLATLPADPDRPGDGRHGRLVIVSRNLARMVRADDVAPHLLDAIERWGEVAPALEARFAQLEADSLDDGLSAEPFPADQALAPLPRAPQWLDGSVFANHAMLMEAALHPDQPHEPVDFPLIYQGASDDLRGPTDDIAGYDPAEGIDFEGEFGVIVDDVALGTDAATAADHVQLVVLINDVSLRAHAGREIATGFGFINAKPSTAFAPVAVTPDELGDAWRDARVHLPLRVTRNDEWFGHPNGTEMTFGFDDLIAYAAHSRRLRAGTIIGSGTVSNADRSAGSACIAERRAIEMLDAGQPSTGFLQPGERVRLEVLDADGGSVFGTIDQRVA